MLEIIAVPFATQLLHDLYISATFLLPVFRQLVKASLDFAQIVFADEVPVHIKNMNLVSGNQILDGIVGKLLGNRILAGFVSKIRLPLNCVVSKVCP